MLPLPLPSPLSLPQGFRGWGPRRRPPLPRAMVGLNALKYAWRVAWSGSGCGERNAGRGGRHGVGALWGLSRSFEEKSGSLITAVMNLHFRVVSS
jgi:hypothetical protein